MSLKILDVKKYALELLNANGLLFGSQKCSEEDVWRIIFSSYKVRQMIIKEKNKIGY
jgi:hypothetical protein